MNIGRTTVKHMMCVVMLFVHKNGAGFSSEHLILTPLVKMLPPDGGPPGSNRVCGIAVR